MLRTIKRALSLGRKRDIPLIEESLWRRATQNYAFIARLTPEENRRLRYIASEFLAGKSITGAQGIEITELMRVQIAAQACILVLELGVQNYEGWQEIVVYPSQFVPEREVVDDAGVVHTTRNPLSGEAWLGGPVVLSYEDVARSGDPELAIDGYNVVIHEFAHKLDMLNGEPNGFPPLHRGMRRDTWQQAFMQAYLAFCKAADKAEQLLHYDRGAALDALPIDPYAAESPAEFFAVMSEAFFETPEVVAEAFPDVFAQLKLFYRQDPLRT
ncbi:MAG: zinc-dependent peptidase [Betaproteobacteria bacterium]|nr:zinc-dependent peptidase [Betaproteobacteria bacterium]